MIEAHEVKYGGMKIMHIVAKRGGSSEVPRESLLSFAEGLYTQHLVETAATWAGWRTDGDAARTASDPFVENTLRIGGDALGAALAKALGTNSTLTLYIH